MTVPTSPEPFPRFPPQAIEFLVALRANNTKSWFHLHRADYEQYCLGPARAFVVAAGQRLREFVPGIVAEPRVLGSIFRLNRDMRFSRDGCPYKDYMDLWFWEGDRKTASSGFYLRISPDVMEIGVGCRAFDSARTAMFRRALASPQGGADLLRIAEQIEYDGYEIGRSARIPSGYDPDMPAARFLGRRSLYVRHDEAPEVVTEAHLLDVCVLHWQALAPLHRWLMSMAHYVRSPRPRSVSAT